MNLPAPPYGEFKSILNEFNNSKENFYQNLDKELRIWLDSKEIFHFSNCFTAISIALRSSIKNNSPYVAVAALGYRRTLDIIKWSGLQPYILDNDLDSLALSLKELRQCISKNNIGCILLQHPMVNSVDIEEYLEISKEYQVPLIVDSVEVTGSGAETRKSASFSAYCESISLHPSKVLNGAEGGILSFDNQENISNFKRFINDIGIFSEKHNYQILFNQEPIHKILTLASLRNYKNSNSFFKVLYLEYINELSKINEVTMIKHDINLKNPNFKTILIKLNFKLYKNKDLIIQDLNKLNIGARGYYSPLHRDVLSSNREFNNAKRISESHMILPISFNMNIIDVRYICKQLKLIIIRYKS